MSSLSQLNDQADLQKLKSQLEIREQAVAQKELNQEKLQKELEVKIKVLDGKIASKADELIVLEEKALKQKLRLSEETKSSQQLIEKSHTKLAEVKSWVKKALDSLEEAKSLKSKAAGELKSIQDQIAERTKYLNDQEQEIASAISVWNGQLEDIKLDGEKALKNKENTLREVNDLDRRRSTLILDIEALSNKKSTLEATYEDTADKYKKSLDDMRDQLTAAKVEFREMMEKTEQRFNELEGKEKEIAIKNQALTRKSQELYDENRRIDSKRSTFGLQ